MLAEKIRTIVSDISKSLYVSLQGIESRNNLSLARLSLYKIANFYTYSATIKFLIAETSTPLERNQCVWAI